MSGKQPSLLDSYFSKNPLQPDELPSHTFVAQGKTEVPRRSDTIAGTIRRPDLSIRHSISRLRRKSISHTSEKRSSSEERNNINIAPDRSDSVMTKKDVRPLRMQSSLSRLRQRVGLDKDLYVSPPVSKPATPEPEAAPSPIQKDYPPLRMRKSFSRIASYASSHYSEPEQIIPSMPMMPHPPSIQRQPSTIQRKPSPQPRQPVVAATKPIPNTKLLARPKRADSGTAIAFDDLPEQQRPMPFQEIMAVQSFADRMAMYKKTREFWACADHGLVEWTGKAGGPRMAKAGA
jgi:hypothetical protein